mmetsp:Transcript_74254/g.131160  ORF Transcript_74254/g.131160 Transcript_74254/m.131160 type:complete len:85 (+) Transcript_74254:40-294(+)
MNTGAAGQVVTQRTWGAANESAASGGALQPGATRLRSLHPNAGYQQDEWQAYAASLAVQSAERVLCWGAAAVGETDMVGQTLVH